MNSTTDMSVANKIAEQIGSRAFYMMGSKYLSGTADALSFKIIGSKSWNHVKVTLNADDSYKVSFYKFRGVNIVAVKDVDSIQVSQLRDVISENTGLTLSL